MTNLPPAMSLPPMMSPIDAHTVPVPHSDQNTTMLDAQENDQLNDDSNIRLIDGHSLTQLRDLIRDLEIRLLTPPYCTQRYFIELTLDDQFHEYQKTGERIDKAAAIQWIISSAGHYHWRFSDFSLTAMSEDTVLAHYFAYQHNPETKRCKRSRHSSIWHYHQERWQLFYHHANSLALPSES
jgi:hypothetical protein